MDRRPKACARRCQTREANVRVSPLAWYLDLGEPPPAPQTPSQSFSARVSFVLVPEGARDQCMKDGLVFQCGVGVNNRRGCREDQNGGFDGNRSRGAAARTESPAGAFSLLGVVLANASNSQDKMGAMESVRRFRQGLHRIERIEQAFFRGRTRHELRDPLGAVAIAPARAYRVRAETAFLPDHPREEFR